MKGERWICALWAWVLAFCAAFGAVGAMASGLHLEANMLLLAAVFTAVAAVTAVLCVFRLYLLPMGGLIAACVLFGRRLLASARFFVEHASRIYDRAYHWGVPQWQGGAAEGTSALWVLAVLGSCVICVVVVSVLSGRGLRMGALMVLFPLIPCIIVTDTVPGTGYLFCMLLSVVLLLLSDRVRASSLRKGNALLLRLALPVLLGLGLLFVMIPREGYDGQAGAQKLEDFVVSLWEGEPIWERIPQTTLPVHGDQKEQVDLSSVGVNPALGIRVMSVKAQTTGTIYLRGSAFDTYTGTGWEASGEAFAADTHYTGQGQLRYAAVQTARIHSVLYIPYAPYRINGGFTEGKLPNTEKLREYTMAYREPAGYTPQWDGRHPAQMALVGSSCLQLPFETLLWAKSSLPERVIQLKEQGCIYHAAMEIAHYVKESARYDRMTASMPAGKVDFARWFLEESDTGYCTHFATAATVLLRAAGIPARYVTGYLAHTQAGRYAQVTTDEAHAWVEYYVYGVGWVVLEVTPGQGQSPVIPTQSPTEQTTAPTAQPTQTQSTNRETESPSGSVPTPPASNPLLPSESEGTVPDTTGPGLTESTQPDAPEGPEELPGWIKTGGTVLLALLVSGALMIAQWQLRLWLRQKRLRRGRPNTRLLIRWREAERICWLLKQRPPESLHRLALKARFSQHTISKQELLEFERETDGLRALLREKHFGWQLIYRLVFALY